MLIWNPWHGCIKCSEGCENCYMYYLDRVRGERNGREIYRVKGNFSLPLQKDRSGSWKIRSGSTVYVCMTSDFFLAEADSWRAEAWDIIRERWDLKFYLVTKRPQRVLDCLPPDWGNGWENVFFSVTCENQRRADERMPLLLSLPFLHKGVMCTPLIGAVSLSPWLSDGQVEQVICGGENYDGARPCDYDWVKKLGEECREKDVTFCFMETGTVFIKDGKRYHIPKKSVQSAMATKSGQSYTGKPVVFHLHDSFGIPLNPGDYAPPHFCQTCQNCGSRPVCGGCSECGSCRRGGESGGFSGASE